MRPVGQFFPLTFLIATACVEWTDDIHVAAPVSRDEEKIEIEGYLIAQVEFFQLFLTKQDYRNYREHGIVENCFNLTTERVELFEQLRERSGTNVSVQGVITEMDFELLGTGLCGDKVINIHNFR